MASPLAYALVLLALPFFAAAQTAPATPPDPVAILEKGQQYTVLLKLLKKANLVDAIANQLKSSTQGLSIFAPTDNAFSKLPPGALNKLSTEQQTSLLQLHVLNMYVSFAGLDTVSNPARTLASNLTLTIIGGNNQANVSTGAVNTRVNSPLYDKSPLAIFPVDDVLIPPELAGSAPVAAPAEEPTAPSTPEGSKGPSASPTVASATGIVGRRLVWGALFGAALACFTFF